MKRATLNLLIILLTFGLAGAAGADEKPSAPTTLKGGRIVSVEEAKTLSGQGATSFFDTRNALNFGKGHVPGAKSISYKEKSEFKADFDGSQDQFDLAKLSADKSAKILFYSDGPQGWKSYKAAVLAIKGGYRNIMWMRDGFAGWTDKKYSVEQ